MQLVLRERERETGCRYMGGYRGIKVPLRQTRLRFSASAYVTANVLVIGRSRGDLAQG